jgi:hypothetical protein
MSETQGGNITRWDVLSAKGWQSSTEDLRIEPSLRRHYPSPSGLRNVSASCVVKREYLLVWVSCMMN